MFFSFDFTACKKSGITNNVLYSLYCLIVLVVVITNVCLVEKRNASFVYWISTKNLIYYPLKIANYNCSFFQRDFIIQISLMIFLS